MAKQDKKQRHEAKRKAKRLEARRRDAVSPVKCLADSKYEPECWMSDGTHGQIQMFAHKLGGGLSGAAFFLLDRGVVGLKDGWARVPLGREEFKEMLDSSAANGIPMRPATPEELRRFVAGGARWAHDNGMRLPPDWLKAASLIGGVGDWASADVPPFFIKEFAGHPEDLRQRLIGESFQSFVARRDIRFLFSDAAPIRDEPGVRIIKPDEDDEFDDEDEKASERFEAALESLPIGYLHLLLHHYGPAAAPLADETSRWLLARGEAPSSELVQGWKSLIVACLLAEVQRPGSSRDEFVEWSDGILAGLLRRTPFDRYEEHQRTVEQSLEYLGTNPNMMAEAIAKYVDGPPPKASKNR